MTPTVLINGPRLKGLPQRVSGAHPATAGTGESLAVAAAPPAFDGAAAMVDRHADAVADQRALEAKRRRGEMF